MKKLAIYGIAAALALLLVLGGSVAGGSQFTTAAFAQDSTAVPTVGTQTEPVRPTQPVENNNDDGFPWGLLGLLGLAGLAGLRREPETVVQRETTRTTPTVGVYDSKK